MVCVIFVPHIVAPLLCTKFHCEIFQLVIVGTQGGKAANSLLQADAALSSMDDDVTSREAILTEMAIATGRGDVRIMMGLPFASNPTATKRGAQSLPDKRMLDKQRVHAILDERKGKRP